MYIIINFIIIFTLVAFVLQPLIYKLLLFFFIYNLK